MNTAECVKRREREKDGTEREGGRRGEGGLRSPPAWAPADSRTGRSQAHHVSSVCGNPPSSNDEFATRLPLSDLGKRSSREEERGGGREEGVCVCVCV